MIYGLQHFRETLCKKERNWINKSLHNFLNESILQDIKISFCLLYKFFTYIIIFHRPSKVCNKKRSVFKILCRNCRIINMLWSLLMNRIITSWLFGQGTVYRVREVYSTIYNPQKRHISMIYIRDEPIWLRFLAV